MYIYIYIFLTASKRPPRLPCHIKCFFPHVSRRSAKADLVERTMHKQRRRRTNDTNHTLGRLGVSLTM